MECSEATIDRWFRGEYNISHINYAKFQILITKQKNGCNEINSSQPFTYLLNINFYNTFDFYLLVYQESLGLLILA